MSIASEEQALFDELRAADPTVIIDGIADETEYLAARYKIVYVLKEVNGGKAWDLRKFIRNGGRPQTWDNIARWTEGILSWEKEIPWSKLNFSAESNAVRRSTVLKKIAAINLKKTSGGHTANSDVIHKAAISYQDVIRRQIKIYNPDIIICCGTEYAFTECCYGDAAVNWQCTSRGIWYFIYGSTIVISFVHPEARVKDAILYYALIDAVREIMSKLTDGITGNHLQEARL